jgi:hypothetical protein
MAQTFLRLSGQTYQFNATAGMVPTALAASSTPIDRIADLENFGIQEGNYDNTGAFFDAVKALRTGGVIRFPVGTFKASGLNIPTGTQSLRIEGVQADYSAGGIGTRIVAGETGTCLLSAIANATKVAMRDITLDGASIVDTVFEFRHEGGKIADFFMMDNVDFHNVKDGGCFIGSVKDDFVGGENALVVLRGCTFNLNASAVPSAKGTAIYMRNRAAWGWLAEKCNFFGDSGEHGSVVIEAGELTIRMPNSRTTPPMTSLFTALASSAGTTSTRNHLDPYLMYSPL